MGIAVWLAVELTLLQAPPTETVPSIAPGVHDFASLTARVQELSERPYSPPPELPTLLGLIDYDTYRHIVFKQDQAIWYNQNRPFWMETFHRGFVQQSHVRIHTVSNSEAHEVPFLTDRFHYWGPVTNLKLSPTLGHAGIKIAGRFPGEVDGEEILTLLGGCYFRARAQQHVYGSSARGITVDSAIDGPEEFPAFRELWILDPNDRGSKVDNQNSETAPDELTVLALLDGPSVVGAYELTLKPGGDCTAIEVRSEVFFRQIPERVGFAPITSMWMWGDGQPGPRGDHRPEVHDADGLLIETKTPSGTGITTKQTFRPLNRLTYPSIVRYPADGLSGFGLVQRDRNPSHYRDDEAKYVRRPSVWITPGKGFENGLIELFELPSEHEGIDNVNAWWTPAKPIRLGEPLRLDYRIDFCSHPAPTTETAQATSFTVDRCDQSRIALDIHFSGDALRGLPSEAEANVLLHTIRGRVVSQVLRPARRQPVPTEPEAAGDETPIRLVSAPRSTAADERLPVIAPKPGHSEWTLSLIIEPTESGPVEVEAAILQGDEFLTERWSYLCPRQDSPVSLPPWRRQELLNTDQVTVK